MGIMIGEGGRKGKYIGKWDNGEEAGYHYTRAIAKFGWATRLCIARTTTPAFQRFEYGERSSPGGVFFFSLLLLSV